MPAHWSEGASEEWQTAAKQIRSKAQEGLDVKNVWLADRLTDRQL
jgi:hypothetical protein